MNIVYGTAAEWAAATGRILLQGQLGYESTADVLKVGDGVAGWAALPAVGAGGGAAWGTITGTISAQTDLAEYIRDTMGLALAGAQGVSIAVDDPGNSVTIGFVVENRTSDPVSPATGQIWLRTDL